MRGRNKMAFNPWFLLATIFWIVFIVSIVAIPILYRLKNRKMPAYIIGGCVASVLGITLLIFWFIRALFSGGDLSGLAVLAIYVYGTIFALTCFVIGSIIGAVSSRVMKNE